MVVFLSVSTFCAASALICVSPRRRRSEKKGGLVPWSAFAKLPSSFCTCMLCQPLGEREGEQQRDSSFPNTCFIQTAFIFGNATPRLRAAGVVDGAKTLSWAHYQLEGYHRTLSPPGRQQCLYCNTRADRCFIRPSVPSQTVTNARCPRGRHKTPSKHLIAECYARKALLFHLLASRQCIEGPRLQALVISLQPA